MGYFLSKKYGKIFGKMKKSLYISCIRMRDMIKLIDRISTKNKEILMESVANYPFTMKSVMEELETKSYWTSLSYETVSALVSHLRLKGYGPSDISEVFENNN